MSKNLGVIGRVYAITSPTLVAGEDCAVVVQLVYKGDSCPDPYKIVGFVGATGQFPSADGYAFPIAATGSLESADLGLLRFDLSAATSSMLLPGDEQNFQVRMRDETGLKITQLLGVLNVASSLF